MRYFRLFFLYFQEAITHRSRVIVWFLVAILNPLIGILFWSSATTTTIAPTSIANYYFLLAIFSSLLLTHIETDIAMSDIKEGVLVWYLLKPLPYLVFKFFIESSYRIMQGVFGIIFFIMMSFFFHHNAIHIYSIEQALLLFCLCVCAFFVSFLFKMIVGMTAFWFIDFRGFLQFIDVTLWTLSGIVIPLRLIPPLYEAAQYTPFPYMLYYPVTGFQGLFTQSELGSILFRQILWIVILSGIYTIMWKKGNKKFTAIGM